MSIPLLTVQLDIWDLLQSQVYRRKTLAFFIMRHLENDHETVGFRDKHPSRFSMHSAASIHYLFGGIFRGTLLRGGTLNSPIEPSRMLGDAPSRELFSIVYGAKEVHLVGERNFDSCSGSCEFGRIGFE